MFICSVRAGTLRFFGVVCLCLVALAALIVFVPADATVAAMGETVEIKYDNVRDNEARRAFLAQFGWQVSESETESASVTVPAEFDKVFASYNEMQKGQGLDLSSYRGRTVERYTYTVQNYEGYEGTVYANLLVYRGRVIGGDICAADASGFLHGFEKAK